MGLKCHLDTGKQKILMSLYFDKNAQTPQKDTVNSWRVNKLYIENLKSICSEEKSQITRFTERLLIAVRNIAARTISKKYNYVI